LSRWLIGAGLALVALGVLWPLVQRSGLGRLPGDIWIEGEHFQLYFPVTSALLVSLLISLVLWLINR
jgi:hypothetical protein